MTLKVSQAGLAVAVAGPVWNDLEVMTPRTAQRRHDGHFCRS